MTNGPMLITLPLLRSWGACWTDEEILARLGGRTAVTPREVASDRAISAADRLWVAAHCLAHRDPDAASLWAVERAEAVAHLAGTPEDEATLRGVLAGVRRAVAETPRGSDARWAALSAARSTAYSAALSTAYSAACRAALSAAESAAWSAAWSAAYAAWSAAESAAWSAAYAAQSAAWWAAASAALEDSIAAALDRLGAEAGA